MKLINNKSIYVKNHNTFIENIIIKKRLEIVKILNNYIKVYKVKDILDVGTTEDETFKSSNFIIKKLKNKDNILKSISDQNIKLKIFNYKLKHSITKNLDKKVMRMSSDLVLSNATIEHVGSRKKQIQMIKNIIKLTKKVFIIITPNRHYPIDFHSKIPLIHWLPKKIHRWILGQIGMKDLSKEKNLNLLSIKDIETMMRLFNKNIDYKISYIKLLMIPSNIIIFGKKKD
jgi:hypothetical protein